MVVKRIDTMTSKDLLTAAGLSGKTVTNVFVHTHGSVTAWEIVYSGGSAYLKCKQGKCEAGGTIEWGTGTAV